MPGSPGAVRPPSEGDIPGKPSYGDHRLRSRPEAGAAAATHASTGSLAARSSPSAAERSTSIRQGAPPTHASRSQPVSSRERARPSSVSRSKRSRPLGSTTRMRNLAPARVVLHRTRRGGRSRRPRGESRSTRPTVATSGSAPAIGQQAEARPKLVASSTRDAPIEPASRARARSSRSFNPLAGPREPRTMPEHFVRRLPRHFLRTGARS